MGETLGKEAERPAEKSTVVDTGVQTENVNIKNCGVQTVEAEDRRCVKNCGVQTVEAEDRRCVKNCGVQTVEAEDRRYACLELELKKCSTSINKKNRQMESFNNGLDSKENLVRELQLEVDRLVVRLRQADNHIYDQSNKMNSLIYENSCLQKRNKEQNDLLVEIKQKKQEEIEVRNKVRLKEEERHRVKRELEFQCEFGNPSKKYYWN